MHKFREHREKTETHTENRRTKLATAATELCRAALASRIEQIDHQAKCVDTEIQNVCIGLVSSLSECGGKGEVRVMCVRIFIRRSVA